MGEERGRSEDRQTGSLPRPSGPGAKEEAEATGTYLFKKHPSDRMSKEDLKERGDTAAENDAYNVKYHHYVPLD